jgi:hypothetical protein
MEIRFALPSAIIKDNSFNIVALSGADHEAGRPFPEFVRACVRLQRPS